MSLLYECINGIIQGGILGGSDDSQEEIAVLCVSKLRGMIMVEGDANCELKGPYDQRNLSDHSSEIRGPLGFQ